MTNFDLWIKGCEENKTKVFELEPGLYKTWNEYLSGNNYYRTSPVYHVWDVDTRIYCGMSLKTAYEVYGMNKNDVVQFTENHKWCGCLGIITEDKGYDHPRRYMIGVPVPSNDGKPQMAYIFDDGSNIEMIGEAVMIENADD